MTRPTKEVTAKAKELSGLSNEAFKALKKEERAAWLEKAAQELGADTPDEDEAGDGVECVQMVRDAEKFPAPHTAEVHPDEVNNYAIGGWVRAD